MTRLFVAIFAAVAFSTATLANDFNYGQRLYTIGDYAGALKVWEPLAEGGDARAQYSIAVMYLQGRGVERDEEMAMTWASRAAERGYAPAVALRESLQPARKHAGTPSPAPAVSGPDDPERHLIVNAVAHLLEQISLHATRGGVFEYGEIDVEPRAGGYDVAVADILAKTETGAVIDIGTVTGRVLPRSDLYYDITAEIPGDILFRDAEGRAGRFTSASQEIRFLWDRRLETTTEFVIRLSGLQAVREGTGSVLEIGQLTVKSDITERTGRWSGPLEFSLQDLVAITDDDATLEVGTLGIGFTVTRLDLPRYLQAFQDLQPGDDRNSAAVDQFIDLVEAVGVAFKASRIHARGGRRGDFSLDSATYALSIADLDKPLFKLLLDLKHSGLRDSGTRAASSMAVRDLDASVVLDRMPIETVVKTAVTAGLELTLFGELTSGPGLIDRLRADLAGASSRILIERAHARTDQLEARMSGSLLAQAGAALAFAGVIEAELSGIGSLEAAQDGQTQQTLAGGILDAVKEAGRAKGSSDTLTYHMELKPDGRILINDQAFLPGLTAGTDKPRH